MMSELRCLIEQLIESGCDPVTAGEVVARVSIIAAADAGKDEAAERRRAKDRERARNRGTILPSVRSMVLARDGECCVYCGDEEGPFHLDHVLPWSRGGQHTVENLVVACRPCNLSKSDKTPEEW